MSPTDSTIATSGNQTSNDASGSIGADDRTPQWTKRRLAIIQAAAEVFNDIGFERGTTKHIAERVGLSQSSVYHYVGSKADLMAEIVQRVDQMLSPIVVSTGEAAGSARERLRQLIIRFTEEVIANQAVFAACWNELDSVPQPALTEFLDHRDRFISMIADLVDEAQEEGALPRGDRAVATQAIVGMVSSSYLWYSDRGTLTATEIGEQFSQLLGLGVDDGGRDDTRSARAE